MIIHCPHCGKDVRQATPRLDKAKLLHELYSKEFTEKSLELSSAFKVAQALAEIAKQALDSKLVSTKTVRGDRVRSLVRHFHAFSQEQRPYGQYSRKAGMHHVWIKHRYGIDCHKLHDDIEILLRGMEKTSVK